MAEIIRLHAFLVSNQIDIKGIKSKLQAKPLADSSSELFYSEGGRYQYYCNYGVIVFSGFLQEEMKAVISELKVYLKEPANLPLRDEFQIRVAPGEEMYFEFAEAVVGRLTPQIVRVAMLNLAQSVALDYYHDVSEKLLTEIK